MPKKAKGGASIPVNLLRFLAYQTLIVIFAVIVAFVVSSLTGIWFPRAKLPVFFVISFVGWCAAWKYAGKLDRILRK